jgi:GTPase
MNLPEVLIVGRPNVGKSTLFNRLTGKSLALVDNQPGSTRDLKSFPVEWQGVHFLLTDSGGWVPGEKDSIAAKVGQMLEERFKKISAILLIVDGADGMMPADETVVRYLRKLGIPTWLLANKADRVEKWDEMFSDFVHLGFDKHFPISAVHGLGIDDFLDSLVAEIKTKQPPAPEGEEKRLLRIAILGKPNVGKSSLVNAVLGEKRMIVDDLPGTTHDAVPVIIETDEDPLIMVDTAGIRAPKHQDSRIEKISVDQALYELQTCQVAIMIVDGEKGITHQDVTISRIIHDAFRPVVILVNKWDIHHKGAEQAQAERIIRRELRLIHFAPILFISAITGQNLDQVLPTVSAVFEESCKETPTSMVNQALQAATTKQSPPFRKGNQIRIFYGYQRKGHPPAFEVFASHPESATPSYMRFLEEELRKAVGMESTPLQIVLKEKPDKHEHKKTTYKRNFDPNAEKHKKIKKNNSLPRTSKKQKTKNP